MAAEASCALGDLLRDLPGQLFLPPGVDAEDLRIHKVTDDSRLVRPGDLFIAVAGSREDGHEHIGQAIAAGAAAIVAQQGHEPPDCPIPLFVAADGRAAAAGIAANRYGRPAAGLTMIAVTGTNGKTTVSYLVETLLLEAGLIPGVIGTVEYRYHCADGKIMREKAPLTTPGPLALHALLRRMADAGVSHVVMEASSHAIDQQRLGTLLFAVAAFTNLSWDHLDYHHDLESYFQTKKLLFTRYLAANGVAVVFDENAEKSHGGRLVSGLAELGFTRPSAAGTHKRLFVCALSSGADIAVAEAELDASGSDCRFNTPAGAFSFRSKLLGSLNVKNLLCATGIGIALGIPPKTIGRAFCRPTLVPGRLQLIGGHGKKGEKKILPTLVVDYAHTPKGLEAVLDDLRPMVCGRIICVFGCGGDRDRKKRPLMGRAVSRRADIAILTSDNPRTEKPADIARDVEEGLREYMPRRFPAAARLPAESTDEKWYLIELSRRKAIALALELAGANDLVLVSGKGHETRQIVGKRRLLFNDCEEILRAATTWTRKGIVEACGAKVAHRGKDRVWGGIATDSRKIKKDDIFLTLTGERFDAAAFIPQATAAGAGAVLTTSAGYSQDTAAFPAGVTAFVHDDPLHCLGELARYRRLLLTELTGMKVAAITGSCGKTTIKEMTAAIVSRKQKTLKTEGNLNNLIGLPLSLLPADCGHEVAILEMGMNRPGEIARLAAIARPDAALIANVHAAHLEGLGSLAMVAAAKEELFSACGPDAVFAVNIDDPLVRAMTKKYRQRQISFGMAEAAMIRASDIGIPDRDGISFSLHLLDEKFSVRIAVPGRHMVADALAAAALAMALGAGTDDIVQGLASYTGSERRMRVGELAGGLVLVNDCYNANPASMRAAIETVAALAKGKKCVAVLGDMFELGAQAEKAHLEMGLVCAKSHLDFLVTVGDLVRHTAAESVRRGMPAGAVWHAASHEEAAGLLAELFSSHAIGAGDFLLVKGSRGMRMEKTIDLFTHAIKSGRPGLNN